MNVDLHTHSIISHDGGISEKDYKKVLDTGVLDCVAITDHNDISFAQKMHKELGERIIIGEEIDTQDGQIAGLFLTKRLHAWLSVSQAIREVREQGGLVYVPHPLQSWRNSINREKLEEVIGDIDIIEVFNSRTIKKSDTEKTLQFAQEKGIAMASSSDAHGYRGLGVAYSILSSQPTVENLVKLLKHADYKKGKAPILTRFAPKFHRVRHSIHNV